MDRTNIYLERRQTEALDRRAADEGVSRAEIIRRLLDQALHGSDDNLDSDLAAIDESFGAMLDADVPRRGPDERDVHLARIWQQA
ncbi:MAG: CopG family transcriptional regulator [Ilumatobacteraceae bacterium]